MKLIKNGTAFDKIYYLSIHLYNSVCQLYFFNLGNVSQYCNVTSQKMWDIFTKQWPELAQEPSPPSVIQEACDLSDIS